jgi:hypothetical protein
MMRRGFADLKINRKGHKGRKDRTSACRGHHLSFPAIIAIPAVHSLMRHFSSRGNECRKPPLRLVSLPILR